ncbi:MAG: L-2-amino-thiazoline-4-carboxylic acid hydrolase [Oscillospiraceae bacterium]|nr:L-2-amino-thiazoline-4-carboxylic acid hydrolase [Oscillospiraceae bacterium]
MNLKETKLFFLEEDCINQFGSEKGRKIYSLTAVRFDDLLRKADHHGNGEIEFHLTMNLYPTMAYYQALQKYGLSKEDALSLVRKETTRAANIKKAEQAKTAKLPCAYLMYRMFVKSVMKKKFPPEGWYTQWIRCEGKEIHFDMTRCTYKDICDNHTESGLPTGS